MTSVDDRPAVAPGAASDRTAATTHQWGWTLKWLAILAGVAALGAYHWLVYVPHLDQPHLGTILDRLFDVSVAATMVFIGLLLGLRGLRLLRLASAFPRQRWDAG